MSQEQPQGQPEPGEGGLSARGTVLVPLDGSPTAAAALPLARAAALILDAPLHVLHACDEPLSTEELMTRLFLSPEDLAVFKMLFFRTKDVLDVERLLGFLGSEFDTAYARVSLVEIVGEEDDRIARWDRLVSDVQRRG